MDRNHLKWLAIGLVVGAGFSSSGFWFFIAKTPNLSAMDEKGSYALGQQIGKNLKNQKIEFHGRALALAIEDAVLEKEPRLPADEMRTALSELQKEAAKKHVHPGFINKSPQSREEELFFQEKETEAEIRKTRSGVLYKIETMGKGAKAEETDIVRLHLKGKRLNGKEFSNSLEKKQELEIPMMALPKGIAEALQVIQVGGKVTAYIPANLLRNSPLPLKIPPNTSVELELSLLETKAFKKKK